MWVIRRTDTDQYVAWAPLGPYWSDTANAAGFSRQEDAAAYWKCFGEETLVVVFVQVA
jgi:hypothetical protein